MFSRWLIESLASLALFVMTAVLVRRFYLSRRRLPPGPLGLPLVGYLPFIGNDSHLHYAKLAEKFGPIFSLRLGNQFVVVLSDYKLVREAFRREDFTARPMNEFSNILEGYGIINSQGRLWKSQRKFLHDRLRKFGMTCVGAGNRQMEVRIMREVEHFLETLANNKHAPTNLSVPLATSISNVICSLMMSLRFGPQDPKFNRFMQLITEGFKLFGSLNYVNFVPFMRYLPGLQDIIKKIAVNRAEMASFFQESVDDHKKTFDSSNIRDLVDYYLYEIEKAKENGTEGDIFDGMEPNRQIQQVVGDLFSAGMETIKTTILWAVIYMIHEPKVAKLVQEELDQVVGRKKLPTFDDRPYLPYTEATILEVLRISSVVPLGTTHSVIKDVEFAGYTIPKNANVVPLIHSIHADPLLWDRPEEFRPQRFLTSEGKVCKPEFFLPFGVGRRMCLGDVLARMELFEFFSCLMHTFHIEVPEGQSLPSLKPVTGITLTPDDFQVKLVQRPLIDSPHSFLNASGTTRNIGAH